AAALGRACAEPTFELVERRRLDEDRHAVGNLPLYGERSVGLQIQQRRLPVRADARDLGPERPAALAPLEVDMLEEVTRIEPPLELRMVDEVVLPPVLLALTPVARRRRDGKLELR